MSLKKKFRSLIVSADAYGALIQLTYQNSSTHKTLFGGCVTILIRLGILLYLAIRLSDCFNNTYSLKVSQQKRVLTHDATTIHLNPTNFDIAIYMDYMSPDLRPDLVDHLDEYLSFSIG